MEFLRSMTAEEKYTYLLLKLSEKMKEQDDTIYLQKYQIDELEKKLAEATNELAELKGEERQ